MKRLIPFLALIALLANPGRAATPEQEKTFVAAYRQAFEKSDAKALTAFLSTTGAEPDAVELFTSLLTRNLGAKVISMGLEALKAEDEEQLGKSVPLPNGKLSKLPLKPVRLLVVSLEVKNDDGSTRTTLRKMPVAEKDGRLVIPVPVPAEK